jgi:hypothetical protein
VTHNPENAAYSTKTILLKDGRLQNGSKRLNDNTVGLSL